MNNILTLIGRVGQEPLAISMESSDSKVVKFSLAVKIYNPAEGESDTMWIDVDAWNGLGDRVMKIVTKGREIMVTGRLAINTFKRKSDGVEIQKPVLQLTGFHVCGAKPKFDEAELEIGETPKKRGGRKPSAA